MNFIQWDINYIGGIPSFSNEYWRPITSLSVPDVILGRYYISNYARVYSVYRQKILTNVISNTGYYRVNLRHNDGTSRYHLLHRILMIEFQIVPNYQNLQVNHINGIKTNNDLNNLEWCTCKQNIQHAYDTGLKFKEHGEDCSYATITNAQAELIAQLITEQKYSHKEIADIVQCPIYIVNNIAAGNTWVDIYNKYQLYKYKREPRPGFSDEQLHQICKFFEDHKNDEYRYLADLYKDALKTLFNIEYNQSDSASMSRIYHKQTRKDITTLYNF